MHQHVQNFLFIDIILFPTKDLRLEFANVELMSIVRGGQSTVPYRSTGGTTARLVSGSENVYLYNITYIKAGHVLSRIVGLYALLPSFLSPNNERIKHTHIRVDKYTYMHYIYISHHVRFQGRIPIVVRSAPRANTTDGRTCRGLKNNDDKAQRNAVLPSNFDVLNEIFVSLLFI